MPTYQRPGVFVEEKPGAPAPLQGVAANTLAILGPTIKGPDHQPILVTSFGQFEDVFGGFAVGKRVPTAISAFFDNGGSNAYVVRITPDDAVPSELYIQNATVTQALAGDGATQQFTPTLTQPPVPGSVAIDFHYDDVAVVGDTAVVTPPDNVIAIWRTTTPGVGEGQLAVPAGLTDAFKPGSVTINWTDTDGAGAQSMTDDGAGGFTGDGNAAGSSINYVTGEIVFDATGALPDAGAASTITIDFTPITAGQVTDDGAGNLVGDVDGGGVNTVDYDTGDVDVTFADPPVLVPAALNPITFTFAGALWLLRMKWPGVAGDQFRVRIEGNPNFEVQGQGTFTRWDVMVDEIDAITGDFTERERFTNIDFVDDQSTQYFPLVINDERAGSKIVEVILPAFQQDSPGVLDGVAVLAEAIGSGNGTETNFSGTLVEGNAVPYSLSITAPRQSDSTTMTVTDDGSGNLIGDIDAGGANTIDYETGAFDVTFTEAVETGASNVVVDYYEQAATDSYVQVMAGGAEGSAVVGSDITSPTLEPDRKGLFALDEVSDILLVIVPDFAGDEITDGAILTYADNRQDRWVILSTPGGMNPQEAKDYKLNALNNLSTKAAIYWPWLQIIDPITDKAAFFPPMGHVAGITARTIQRKNVAKAPAGREDGQLRNVIGLEYNASDAELAVLNPIGVNSIIRRAEVGTAVWGARTLDPNNEYRYIQARLTFMFIAKAIFRGTHWIVFENNGSDLWARIRFQLNAFMKGLFRNKFFAGNSEDEAFFVRVDETNNPPESVDLGLVFIDVGFAPTKPAEFVVFRIQQKTLVET